MASIANLIVSMIADTGAFDTDMNRTAKQQAARMKKFEQDAAQAAKAIGVAFTAVGVATTAVVVSTIKAADRMTELADITGLSAEALSRMDFVATKAGVSFESLTTGLGKMQKSLVAARDNTSTTSDMFTRLGLSVEDLLQLSPEKQFSTIAESISKLGNAAERTAAAQAIFGKTGAQLLPVLIKGQAGIDAITGAVDKYGAVISTEFASNAARFNDNIDDMRLAASGLAIQFTSALLPALLDIQEGLLGLGSPSDLAAKAGERLGKVLKTLALAFVIVKEAALLFGRVLLGSVVAVLGAMRAVISPTIGLVTALGEAFKALSVGDFTGALDAVKSVPTKIAQEFTAAIEQVKTAAGFLTETFTDELPAAIDRVNKFFNTNADVVTSTADAYKELGDQTVKAADKLVKFVARSKAANKSIEENLKFVEDLEQAQEEYNKQLQDFIDIGAPVDAMVRGFTEQLEFANKALADGKITAEQYQATLNALSNQLGQTAAGMQDVAQEASVMSVAMDEGIRILERSFQGVWESILNGSEGAFDGILDGFKSMLARIQHEASTGKIILQIENAINGKSIDRKALTEGITSAVSQAVGAAIGGGGEGANIGAAIGGAIGTIWGPVGTAIGSILGGLVGGLFDSDRPAVLQASSFDTSRLSKSDNDTFVDTTFGRTFLRSRRLDQQAIKQFQDALFHFDETIGGFIDDSQVGKVATALEGWSKQIEGEALTVEELLESRFRVILSTFGDDIQDFVNKARGLEEQVARLQIGARAENLFADQPDLFGSRTVAEFLAVVDAFRTGTESITDAFGRVVELLDTVFAVKASLADFAGSDLAGDFNLLLERQGESVVRTVTRMTNDLADAIFSFDGSPEQLVQIGNLALSVRQQELTALALIDSVAKGLNSSLDRLRKDTETTIRGPRAAEDVLFDARALIATVSTARTPEGVAQIAQEFEALIRSLSPEDTKAFGTSTLAIIDSFKLASQASLDRAEQAVLESGEAIRKLVDGFESLIDPLELVAATNERAAAALELIAGVTASNTSEPENYEDQARIISDGIDDALTSGVNNMSAEMVNAIRVGFSGVSINTTIVPRSGGLVTR